MNILHFLFIKKRKNSIFAINIKKKKKKNKIEERIKFLNGVEDFRKNKVKILSYTVSGDKIELSIIMDGEKISGTNNIKDFLNPKRSKYGCRVIGDFICYLVNNHIITSCLII